jgi:7-cyano-7-deazaguanine synthase
MMILTFRNFYISPLKEFNKNIGEDMKSVVLLSGGMDSTTLLYDVCSKRERENVSAVSFNYGQKHVLELECAQKTCRKLGISHKIIDISFFSDIAPSALTSKDKNIPLGNYQEESMKQTVVPNRNMVLLSIAGSYAIGISAKELYYGAHNGDHAIYPDCRSEFVEEMRKVFCLCDWDKLYLQVPYININKIDILKIGTKLKVDYSLTKTCYQSGPLACGKCGSCVERLEAFKLNDLVDPVRYEE